ncbi:Uncharacterized protein TCM_036355 [Theobroma cacao]|uniref:Uncharacterized protein n=1 Tax=Theobroma cacao TaxID=3641 RepID=A0A061FK01_THECC|nr:Uncharacterized protein TCM_036355 [Theobroma cacao]
MSRPGTPHQVRDNRSRSLDRHSSPRMPIETSLTEVLDAIGYSELEMWGIEGGEIIKSYRSLALAESHSHVVVNVKCTQKAHLRRYPTCLYDQVVGILKGDMKKIERLEKMDQSKVILPHRDEAFPFQIDNLASNLSTIGFQILHDCWMAPNESLRYSVRSSPPSSP